MNKQEFAVIAVGIKSAYPASKILEDDASMNFWYRMLKDLNGKVVENAVMEHIRYSPPTALYPLSRYATWKAHLLIAPVTSNDQITAIKSLFTLHHSL